MIKTIFEMICPVPYHRKDEGENGSVGKACTTHAQHSSR